MQTIVFPVVLQWLVEWQPAGWLVHYLATTRFYGLQIGEMPPWTNKRVALDKDGATDRQCPGEGKLSVPNLADGMSSCLAPTARPSVYPAYVWWTTRRISSLGDQTLPPSPLLCAMQYTLLVVLCMPEKKKTTIHAPWVGWDLTAIFNRKEAVFEKNMLLFKADVSKKVKTFKKTSHFWEHTPHLKKSINTNHW